MDLIKELLRDVGISLVYFLVVGLLMVSVLGRSFFPEGSLLDIILTAFQ